MTSISDLTSTNTRRIQSKGFAVQGHEVVFDANKVQASDETMQVPIGPTSFEVKAKLLQFQIQPEDLVKALRSHIHETIKGLPSNCLINAKAVVDAEGDFHNLEISVVIPER